MTEHPGVAYLRNAHEQAEQWATAASDGKGWWLINPRFADHRTVCEFVIEGERGSVVHVEVTEHDVEAHQAEALLIQSNNPAAVMRRVAAERELLDEHPIWDSREMGPRCRTCHGGGPMPDFPMVEMNQAWPCPTLLALAAGWGWEAGA